MVPVRIHADRRDQKILLGFPSSWPTPKGLRQQPWTGQGVILRRPQAYSCWLASSVDLRLSPEPAHPQVLTAKTRRGG